MALKDYYNTGDDSGVNCASNAWYGQTFTASSSYDIYTCKLKVYSAVAGTVTLALYATSAGKPTGAALATATADSSSFAASPGDFFEFTFGTPVSLTSSTQYALVLQMSGSTACGVRRDVSSPTYADGTAIFSNNSGSTWTILSTQDLMFETYSQAGTPVNFSATLTWSASLSAAMTVLTCVCLSATLTWSESLSAAMTVTSSWQTGTFGNIKRLLVIGNNGLWYEDIT